MVEHLKLTIVLCFLCYMFFVENRMIDLSTVKKGKFSLLLFQAESNKALCNNVMGLVEKPSHFVQKLFTLLFFAFSRSFNLFITCMINYIILEQLYISNYTIGKSMRSRYHHYLLFSLAKIKLQHQLSSYPCATGSREIFIGHGFASQSHRPCKIR